MGNFANQVDQFARKYNTRFKLVAQIAVQDTVSMAQRVHKEGGRMRVKTGFLRASIQAAVHSMPSGPTQGEKKTKYPLGTQVAGVPVSVTLLRWDPNTPDVLFVGWTANYARHREAHDGFLRGAVEKWDQTVRKAVMTVRAGFG